MKLLSCLVPWEEPTAYLGPYAIPTAAPHWGAPCATPTDFCTNTNSQISFTSIFELMSLQRIDFSSI